MASENFGVFVHACSTEVIDGTEELPLVASSVTKKCLVSALWDSVYVGILGTANQIVVTPGTHVITLSTPQNIHTGATPQFARLGLGAAADATACLNISQNVATTTDGAILATSASAGLGAQKFSPRTRWRGQGWATGSGGSSQPCDWIAEVQPVQGSTNPTANLVFSSQINSGGYTANLTLTSAGNLSISGTATFSSPTLNGTTNFGGWYFLNAQSSTAGISFGTGHRIVWGSGSSGTSGLTSLTTGIGQSAGGVLEVTNGTGGQWGAVKCGVRDATNAIVSGLTLGHQLSSGTASSSLGIGVLFNLDTTTTPDQNAAQIVAKWSTATHATATSDIIFYGRNAGAALAEVARMKGSGEFVPVGAVTAPSLTGIADGTNAPAGAIGEYLSSTVLESAPVAVVTATPKTLTSIVLTPGRWVVYGKVGAVGALAHIEYGHVAISLVNNTFPATEFWTSGNWTVGEAGHYPGLPLVSRYFSVNTNTTVYAVGNWGFTTGTVSQYGILWAIRIA